MRQTYTSESTGRRISRKRWLQQQLIKQRAWIESCESNGKSYTGPNGVAIRRADREALQSIEAQIG
jgi:hypothetical protein